MKYLSIGLLFFLFFPAASLAKDQPQGGSVEIPREEYDRILSDRLTKPDSSEEEPSYIFGEIGLYMSVEDEEHRIRGEIRAEIEVDVVKKDWTSVPLFPLGTRIKSAVADGKKIRLQSTPAGLAFRATKGTHRVTVVSSIDEQADGSLRNVIFSAPGSAHFQASINGKDIIPTVSPASSIQIDAGERTILTAELLESSQTVLSWNRSSASAFAASKASFVGELNEKSVLWKGEIALEVFQNAGIFYNLLPSTTTLGSVSVDGQDTTILETNDWHTIKVRGSGKHKVQVEFMIPVSEKDGSPQLEFVGPTLPVSRYELKLPGKKSVQVGTGADVQTKIDEVNTTAVAHFPPTAPISFFWTEAVPEETENLIQVNAAIYSSVIAEDGLLTSDVLALIDVPRGERTSLDFLVPKEIQINKITGPDDVKTDWRLIQQDSKQLVRVFFERGLKGEFALRFSYDMPLAAVAGTEMEIPLLTPVDVQRSKGMIALLSGKEFSFESASEASLIRVGANQLPSQWKQMIEKQIVHTFKYSGNDPRLTVKLAVPEKIQGKLDAVIDTLISVGDVALKGNVSIDVVLKSGKLNELELTLPLGVNILNVVAPSLRAHQITANSTNQKVALQFTQDMEGTFLVQLNYERIFGDSGEEVVVPAITLEGAEVQQGRIAVEALSAVEIQPLKSERLSSLEPSELPKRLVLNTSNPILLGFKYFQATPPHDLRLKVVRHQQVEPQSAIIDLANYQTLITRDGVSITSAEFLVRNSRKQFLKLRLPENSEIWSTTVGGVVEKPALESSSDSSTPSFLIRLVNSNEPFKVHLTYKTKLKHLGWFGNLSATLPKSDMVASKSNWEVTLPADARYGKLLTDMDIEKEIVNGPSQSLQAAIMPNLPNEEGSHFSLKKLYATETETSSGFSLFFVSNSLFYVVIMLFVSAIVGCLASLQIENPKTRTTAAGILFSSAMAMVFIGGFNLWIPAILFIGLKLLQFAAPIGQSFIDSKLKQETP